MEVLCGAANHANGSKYNLCTAPLSIGNSLWCFSRRGGQLGQRFLQAFGCSASVGIGLAALARQLNVYIRWGDSKSFSPTPASVLYCDYSIFKMNPSRRILIRFSCTQLTTSLSPRPWMNDIPWFNSPLTPVQTITIALWELPSDNQTPSLCRTLSIRSTRVSLSNVIEKAVRLLFTSDLRHLSKHRLQQNYFLSLTTQVYHLRR